MRHTAARQGCGLSSALRAPRWVPGDHDRGPAQASHPRFVWPAGTSHFSFSSWTPTHFPGTLQAPGAVVQGSFHCSHPTDSFKVIRDPEKLILLSN